MLNALNAAVALLRISGALPAVSKLPHSADSRAVHVKTPINVHITMPRLPLDPTSQAEDQQLKDFGGDYEYYLSKNDTEAQKMAVKEAKAKAIVQSQTKAKSKMTKAEKEKMKKEKAKTFNEAASGKSKRR